MTVRVKQEDWPDLSFIKENLVSRLHSAYWLKSEFTSNRWYCEFDDEWKIEVNFEIRLDDESLLTDSANKTLLDLFKLWLCAQTSFERDGRIFTSAQSAFKNVSTTIFIIDYFLLNAKYFKLSKKKGLGSVTLNDLNELVVRRASGSDVSVTIYEWQKNWALFLRKSIESFNEYSCEELIESYPFLAQDIPAPADCVLGLSNQEIVRARCWLWKNDLYSPVSSSSQSLKVKQINQMVFKNTLRGCDIKLSIPELTLNSVDHYHREFDAVPVRDESSESLSPKALNKFVACLMSLRILDGYPIPQIAFRGFNYDKIKNIIRAKDMRSFRMLPLEIVFSAFRNACDFILDFGNEIVDSYLRLIKMRKPSKPSWFSWVKSLDPGCYISPALQAIGVASWSSAEGHSMKRSLSKEERFADFRARPGLYQVLRVLYGAIQICVGALTARRNSELHGLINGSCVDINESHILFFNRKSGAGTYNDFEARPVPRLVVTSIKLLERLQNGLIDIGCVDAPSKIFSYPRLRANTIVALNHQSNMSGSLDYFCDYFQTPINDLGQRYYIRQHQLRGFFATVFFWNTKFPAADDVLRWYLGHKDVLHLFHYIKQITPDLMYRSISADFTATLLEDEDPAVSDLADLLEKRFGTRKFSVLDHLELTELIDELQEDKQFQIEPITLTYAEKSYEFLYTVARAA